MMNTEAKRIAIADIGIDDALPIARDFLIQLEKATGSPMNAVVVIEVMRAVMELGGFSLNEKSRQMIMNRLKELLIKRAGR